LGDTVFLDRFADIKIGLSEIFSSVRAVEQE
jgi:hypothetical protein